MTINRPNLASLTLLSLASYRVTRAITEDEIFRPAQTLIQAPATPIPPKIKYLLSCPHCLPPYIALALIAAHRVAPRATNVLTTTLAAAAVSTLITDYTLRKEKQSLPSFPSVTPATPAPHTPPPPQSEGTPPPLM